MQTKRRLLVNSEPQAVLCIFCFTAWNWFKFTQGLARGVPTGSSWLLHSFTQVAVTLWARQWGVGGKDGWWPLSAGVQGQVGEGRCLEVHLVERSLGSLATWGGVWLLSSERACHCWGTEVQWEWRGTGGVWTGRGRGSKWDYRVNWGWALKASVARGKVAFKAFASGLENSVRGQRCGRWAWEERWWFRVEVHLGHPGASGGHGTPAERDGDVGVGTPPFSILHTPFQSLFPWEAVIASEHWQPGLARMASYQTEPHFLVWRGKIGLYHKAVSRVNWDDELSWSLEYATWARHSSGCCNHTSACFRLLWYQGHGLLTHIIPPTARTGMAL